MNQLLLKSFLPLLFILLSLTSCDKADNLSSKIDYYHWKQNYEVSEKSSVKPTFIKLIDIGYDKDSSLVDIKTTMFRTSPASTITPVIYIDNEVMKVSNALELSSKIIAIIEKSALENRFNYEFISIDCDWSDMSRENYFTLIKSLKLKSKKKISVTLRLHQIAHFEKSGVPPAHKGILMYYNMSDFKDLETKNYILDVDVAKAYHKNFKSYPLELDLALPLYSQATIIRFSRVVGLIEGVYEKQLDTKIFKPIGNNHYEVLSEHYLNGRLLYKGDKIRLDFVKIKELKRAVSELKKDMKQPQKILFYQWENRASYDEDELKKLW